MSGGISKRKIDYFEKLIGYFKEYQQVFIVTADFVGSKHIQDIRKFLRESGSVMLMGKNTLIRKAIRMHLEEKPELEALLPYVKGNMGFIFIKGDLAEIKKELSENRVAAFAKPGVISPCDVIVPAGNTGMDPTQTSFLQALNIASKITRGQVEIIKEVHLIKADTKVGTSEAALLQKLGIMPFSHGLVVTTVYDNGSVYDASVLDLTDEDLLNKFRSGVANVACLSLATGLPSVAAFPHVFSNSYKNVLALALETGVLYPHAEKVKEMLENPGAFAAQAAPAEAKEEAKEEVVEEESEESEEMDGFDLFG